jgi:hypothetical protein
MIFIDGCADPFLLKSIMDLHAWIRIFGVDRSGSLNDAIGTIDHFIQSAKGDKVEWHKQNYKLPLNLPSRKKGCVSCPSTNLPRGVEPVPPQIENLILHGLFCGLNTDGTKLNCDSLLTRQANSTKECFTFVTVGGSHAEATTRLLEARGHRCQHLHMPHYRSSAVHAGKILEGLGKMDISKDSILVLQIFESGIFWVRRGDSSLHADVLMAQTTLMVSWRLSTRRCSMTCSGS